MGADLPAQALVGPRPAEAPERCWVPGPGRGFVPQAPELGLLVVEVPERQPVRVEVLRTPGPLAA